MVLSRKIIAGALAAVTLAAAVASTSTPASAAWGRSVAAGVIGGLALGAIAAGASRAYYPPAGYYGPPPPAYYPACQIEQRPVFDRWGRFFGYRDVNVCE